MSEGLSWSLPDSSWRIPMILAVPAEAFFGGARIVFSLATLVERKDCYHHRAQS